MCLQPSAKYAVDVEPSIRLMSMAAVYAKRNVTFTGEGYVDIKVRLFAFLSQCPQ